MTHYALPPELGENRERRFDRALAGFEVAEHAAQVHDLENVEPEIAEVVVHRLAQLAGRERRNPGPIVAATGADLGDYGGALARFVSRSDDHCR